MKYRRQVLRAPIEQTVKEVLAEICQEKGYRLLGTAGMPRHVCRDHIPIFVSAPPKISPAEIARFLRGSSAQYWFQRHLELKRWRWGGHLWNPAYYVGTAGHVSAETIQTYMENQKVKGEMSYLTLVAKVEAEPAVRDVLLDASCAPRRRSTA